MSNAIRARLTPQQYVDGILQGDRVVLARAITLVESELPADSELAARLLDSILPHAGKSRRIGITGIPGVGKSTFIDVLGVHVIREYNQKVAVLSVDPSSPVSGGSILGDKTRMGHLATHENAFIRPSPARGHLGGVSRRTREAILLCEAADFSNIFVETVGVGQSETSVRSMTDFFLLLMLTGAGDELQGMKRGILELIDGIAITKADGDNELKAERMRAEYANAMHLFHLSSDGWSRQVLTVSALADKGIPQLWEMITHYCSHIEATGFFAQRRSEQALEWMRELIALGLEDLFHRDSAVSACLPQLQDRVQNGTVTSFAAARELLSHFLKSSDVC